MTNENVTVPLQVNAITIGFSSIELYYLLDYLKVEGLPEISRAEFAALSPDTRAVALGVVQKCLLAREFLQDHNGRLKINPIVLQMLVPHLAPASSIFIFRGGQGPSRLYCFHQIQKLYALRWSDEIDVHHFALFAYRDDWCRAVIGLLAIDHGTCEERFTTHCRCEAQVFAHIQSTAQAGNRSVIEAELNKLNLSADATRSLAEALCQPTIKLSVIATHTNPTNSESEYSATVMQGSGAPWIVLRESNLQDGNMVSVRSLVPHEIDLCITNFLSACP